MKIYFKIIGLLLLLGIAIAGIKIAFFPAHVANQAIDAGYGVVDKTLNADNILSNYEQFHDQYQGAKQQAMNIATGEKHLSSIKDMYGNDATKWTKDIRQDAEFTQQTIDGQIMQYQRIVSDYNSNSKKLNRNLFKDKGLPYELPLDYHNLQ